MVEHRIEFNFKARYFTIGEPSDAIEHLWIVCHGHGHLAQYFIKRFEALNDGKHLIIAPEGLNRYYLEGFTGRVGATWMTKEDRLTDIENYLQFLSSVLNQVKKQVKNKVKITLFGFSQGAATISRFATQTEVEFERLILWAGIFPPDLPPLQAPERLKGKDIYWVYGEEDPYLSAGVMEEQQGIADQLKVKPEVISFNGAHELNDQVLLKFKD